MGMGGIERMKSLLTQGLDSKVSRQSKKGLQSSTIALNT